MDISFSCEPFVGGISVQKPTWAFARAPVAFWASGLARWPRRHLAPSGGPSPRIHAWPAFWGVAGGCCNSLKGRPKGNAPILGLPLFTGKPTLRGSAKHSQ